MLFGIFKRKARDDKGPFKFTCAKQTDNAMPKSKNDKTINNITQ